MRKTKSKPENSPQEKAGGDCPRTPCSPSLESLKGLKGIEYRKAWNKLHRERCNDAAREHAKRNPEWRKRLNLKNSKKAHAKSVKEYGVARCTLDSRESEKKATMARQPWGPVEDDILTCGKYTEAQLVERLGRSIRAIQRRKWRLRQDDSLENAKSPDAGATE